MAQTSVTPAAAPIQVILVEDDRALASELAALLRNEADLNVAGTFGTAEAAERDLIAGMADVVVTDIQLPGRSGIDLIRAHKPNLPSTQFLVLSMFDDDDVVFAALRAGASGYILKRNLRGQLAGMIRDLHSGGAPMSSSIARKLVHEFQGRSPDAEAVAVAGLAPRESELLDLLARGRSYKECAEAMSLKLDTVRTYIRRLYEKLHVHSRHEAVAKARKGGDPQS
ncbi:MAG: response regulator transcription factor [Verrucomicrobiae bacterium]|nr:response regulator transcription factor [Verrucomicrobiae bacterium]